MAANQANVTSVDALDAFRSSLIIFQSKARRALDDATDELRRTRMWLQHEQRTRWENELKKRCRALDQAEQELVSAKLSSLRDNITFQQNAVRKAKAAVAEAEEKLRHIKKWNQNFDAIADPMAKRLEGLRQFLDYSLPKGITYLVHAAQTLEAYAEVHAPKDTTSTAPAAESEPPSA
jgi:chromosome segregation ATPase